MTPDDAGDRGESDTGGPPEDGDADPSGDGDAAPSGDGDTAPSEDGDTAPSGDGGDDPTTVSPDIDDPFPSVTAGTGTPGETDEGEPPEGDAGKAPEAGSPPDPADPTADSDGDDGLGWHGWVLVGGLVVAMVLVPWAIVFLPRMQGFIGSLGLGLRDAYLVLPMVPALGLGVLAVWAAVAYRRRE